MKSFLTGKPSHQAESLAACAPKTPRITTGSATHGSGPQVDVVKEGGKVARIVITCTCGERIEVECLYPAGS